MFFFIPKLISVILERKTIYWILSLPLSPFLSLSLSFSLSPSLPFSLSLSFLPLSLTAWRNKYDIDK